MKNYTVEVKRIYGHDFVIISHEGVEISRCSELDCASDILMSWVTDELKKAYRLGVIDGEQGRA